MIPSRKQEKAYLIGICLDTRKWDESQESFEELKALADTAGVVLTDETMVTLREFTPATYIGKGKVEEIAAEIATKKLDVVIIDAELSPSQSRNLELAWKARVLDRTGIILDIFALHAKSKEGKLQVELAQYQYLYPRLMGAWTHLSKQRGGGVGLRGPGETQLEVDRRRVRERIDHLKKELEKVTSSRKLHRAKRESTPIPMVGLVGYTNAGKSTLFNSLANAAVLVENKLFATLDPKTKKLKLPSGREVLLTDTVGFIHNLPHQLVEAFKSTFEEMEGAHLLLHVVDASNPQAKHQMQVVEGVLEELELNELPNIIVFNKMDLVEHPPSANGAKNISVSALQKEGLEKLLNAIDEELSLVLSHMKLFLPHPYGGLLSTLYTQGRVIGTVNRPKGVEVEVDLPEKWRRKYAEYQVS